MELSPNFSVLETGKPIASETINSRVRVKVKEISQAAIEIVLKVIQAANEELTVKVYGKYRGSHTFLDRFQIDVRSKGISIPYSIRLESISRNEELVMSFEDRELLNIRKMHNNWLVITSQLIPKRPSEVVIDCSDSSAAIVIGSNIIPLNEGKNRVSEIEFPSLSRGFRFDGSKDGSKEKNYKY